MTTERVQAMADVRRLASQRKRTLVLAAAEAAVLRGGAASIAGIAREAGVGRKFVYNHPDLRAEIELKVAQASQRQANDIVSAARVSAASLHVDLANSRAQNRRLTIQLRALEARLSHLEGAHLIADDLLPESMVAELADRQLSQRVTELEQQLFEAQEELRRTVEELEAARTLNRELIQQANRPRPAPGAESSRRSRGPSGPTTTKEERR